MLQNPKAGCNRSLRGVRVKPTLQIIGCFSRWGCAGQTPLPILRRQKKKKTIQKKTMKEQCVKRLVWSIKDYRFDWSCGTPAETTENSPLYKNDAIFHGYSRQSCRMDGRSAVQTIQQGRLLCLPETYQTGTLQMETLCSGYKTFTV